jgi:hypothetical protein
MFLSCHYNPMKLDFQFTSGFLSFADIKDINSRAAKVFLNVIGFSPDEGQFADLYFDGPLPSSLGEGLALGRFNVVGAIPSKLDPFPIFLKFLRDPALTRNGDLVVDTHFRLKATRQSRRKCERVMVQRRPTGLHIGYSTALQDLQTRKRHFAEIIATADLPLQVLDGPSGFRIEKSSVGDLFASGGDWAGNNVTFFKYGRAEEQVPDLLDRMRMIIGAWSDQVFESAWKVDSSFAAESRSTTSQLFHAIAAGEYPAQTTELNMTYFLSDLEGVEALRNLGGPKSVFETSLCSFDLPNNESGEMRVLTTRKGHEIVVGLSDPDAIDLIKKALNLDLIPLER